MVKLLWSLWKTVKLALRIVFLYQWWRKEMETFSALLALCVGNSHVPTNFPHKGRWRGAFTFSLICDWTNSWANNRDAGDLKRHRAHYDIIVMSKLNPSWWYYLWHLNRHSIGVQSQYYWCIWNCYRCGKSQWKAIHFVTVIYKSASAKSQTIYLIKFKTTEPSMPNT